MSQYSTPTGTIVAVVGPSGAGKDSLIDFLRVVLANDERFEFVRRYITRSADAGGEDHTAVSEADFERMLAENEFAVHWKAHDLSYGIPSTTFESLRQGRVLVVNGSRTALPFFKSAYDTALKVVLVTAPKDLLAARLAARGRESKEGILQRLSRKPDEQAELHADLVVNNDASLEAAGQKLLDFVANLVPVSPDDIPNT
jgi:phosphonate metabolism protein PhnN/1,5-bisphosphokinase (PRPP-forming)